MRLTGGAELLKPTHRVATAPLFSNTPSNHAGTCQVSPPPFWTRIYLRRDLALPRRRWETSAQKPYGRIYSLHPGCHTFGNSRLRLLCIGFFITETPSTGVSSVAGWSRVPRRTTCPHLSGYTGFWLEVPSTTGVLENRGIHFEEGSVSIATEKDCLELSQNAFRRTQFRKE